AAGCAGSVDRLAGSPLGYDRQPPRGSVTLRCRWPEGGGKSCGSKAVMVGSDSMRGDDVPGFGKDTPGKVQTYLARVGILAILILAPVSDWRSLRRWLADRYYAGEVYQVSRYEQRYDAMRPLLPKYGVVGYLSDRMEPNEQYRLTVYTLIPLRLEL